MRIRDKLFAAVFLSVIVGVLGACSGSSDDQSSAADTEKETSETVSSSSSNLEEHHQADSEKEEQISETVDTNENTEFDKDSPEDKSDESHTASDKESFDDSKAGNEETDSTSENTFAIKNYLDENYAIEGVHYVTNTWKNEETGKIEYIVNILPDTKEYSDDISEVMHSGQGLYEDERTDKLDKTANAIIRDLPEINGAIHIESVNWVSYDGEFHVTLVQDIK
ncbi:hypothetical protein [Terribacillus sp. DMT04]|uniref:hypothetical protein n=1 Tax=Terribacillus sp. DMT04 TaxID=2850441 RepID=UPI001C2BD425|nr:hypothetical protein [Terribacillus sp. DMT04]QXE00997.1 hypothetical protein KS242_13460 [Terribacillus sp. DMT04]